MLVNPFHSDSPAAISAPLQNVLRPASRDQTCRVPASERAPSQLDSEIPWGQAVSRPPGLAPAILSPWTPSPPRRRLPAGPRAGAERGRESASGPPPASSVPAPAGTPARSSCPVQARGPGHGAGVASASSPAPPLAVPAPSRPVCRGCRARQQWVRERSPAGACLLGASPLAAGLAGSTPTMAAAPAPLAGRH